MLLSPNNVVDFYAPYQSPEKKSFARGSQVKETFTGVSKCADAKCPVFTKVLDGMTSFPWRGSENYAPWRVGIFCPLLYRLPETLETRNFGGWVDLRKNYLWCKFCDPRSTSSRSNDVNNAKFSHFLVKRAALCFIRSRAQTKTDSFNLQKKMEDAQ